MLKTRLTKAKGLDFGNSALLFTKKFGDTVYTMAEAVVVQAPNSELLLSVTLNPDFKGLSLVILNGGGFSVIDSAAETTIIHVIKSKTSRKASLNLSITTVDTINVEKPNGWSSTKKPC